MAEDPYRYFRLEARDLQDQLSAGVLELEKGGDGAVVVQRLLRVAHTPKGAARVVKSQEIAEHAAQLQQVVVTGQQRMREMVHPARPRHRRQRSQ